MAVKYTVKFSRFPYEYDSCTDVEADSEWLAIKAARVKLAQIQADKYGLSWAEYVNRINPEFLKRTEIYTHDGQAWRRCDDGVLREDINPPDPDEGDSL